MNGTDSSTLRASRDQIVSLAQMCAQQLTAKGAWPKANGMAAWWGKTRTVNGKRLFTFIGQGLWLGTDGRLWFLYSRNWWMHAVPVLTDHDMEMLARVKATQKEFRTHTCYGPGSCAFSGGPMEYVPEGLSKSDLDFGKYPLERALRTQKEIESFEHKLRERTAQLLQKAAAR